LWSGWWRRGILGQDAEQYRKWWISPTSNTGTATGIPRADTPPHTDQEPATTDSTGKKKTQKKNGAITRNAPQSFINKHRFTATACRARTQFSDGAFRLRLGDFAALARWRPSIGIGRTRLGQADPSSVADQRAHIWWRHHDSAAKDLARSPPGTQSPIRTEPELLKPPITGWGRLSLCLTSQSKDPI